MAAGLASVGQAGPSEDAPFVADTGGYIGVPPSSALQRRLAPVLAAVVVSFSGVEYIAVVVRASFACALASSDFAASVICRGCKLPPDLGDACASVTSWS